MPEVVATIDVIDPDVQSPVASVQVVEQLWIVIELGEVVLTD